MKKVIIKPKAAADIEAYKRSVEEKHREQEGRPLKPAPTNYTPPKKKRKKKGRKI